MKDTRVSKRQTNLSIDEQLLEEARELGINLSQTMESALRGVLTEERARRWLEENRDAIESYNEHIERRGAFSERFRRS
jgi:antitoxin CcdA